MPVTPQGWREKLARGDGQGLVPLDAARALWDRGWIEAEPKPPKGHRQSEAVAFVQLSPRGRISYVGDEDDE